MEVEEQAQAQYEQYDAAQQAYYMGLDPQQQQQYEQMAYQNYYAMYLQQQQQQVQMSAWVWECVLGGFGDAVVCFHLAISHHTHTH